MNRREELLRLVCAVENSIPAGDCDKEEVWPPEDVVERAAEPLSEIDKREPVPSAHDGDTICNGEWLSGSGGHRVFSGNCQHPATWRELDGGAQFCDEHARAVIVASAPEPVSAPVEDEDGPDVIRDASGFRWRLVAARARGDGEAIVCDSGGRGWFAFDARQDVISATKLQAYWRENYRFAVDETFDEETRRVVKLPANQGRTPDGDVVTFAWDGLDAVARNIDGRDRLTCRGSFDVFTVGPWRHLENRLRDWALANVPEGIEIVDGVPRYRETKKEPEAFFVSKRGYRWHFVETPEEWVAVMFLGGCSSSFAASDPSPSPVRDALRAYLDAKGVAWRKDGGA